MSELKIDTVSERFEDHLKIEKNHRVILSGKFGIGKTYFLKEFFQSRNRDYNTVFIYPVNYVVSSNEDIFELIKVDIIKQLYTTIEKKKKKSIAVTEKVALFVSEKPHHFLKFITASFKKINPFFEIADNIYDGLNKLYTEYKIYEKKLENEFKIDEQRLEEFSDSFNDKVGNIFEEDFITKTLQQKLKEIRKGRKKNVLIIDDLDRIDPEHVFRLLNILSAHNNKIGSRNKFEFDYVIIVCDIENIQNIFYHRYGNKVDFEGYIDKFFSTDIFLYENNEAIKFYIKSIFDTEKEPPGFIELILFILHNLVDQDKLTVRQIVKHIYNAEIKEFTLYRQKELNEKNTGFRNTPNFIGSWEFFVESSDLQILKIFKLASIIYGDFTTFYRHLVDLTKTTDTCESEDLKNVLAFLALQSHIASNASDKLFFEAVYRNDFGDQLVLTELYKPQIPFLSIKYDVELKWNQKLPYDGKASYFLDSRAVNSDRHQYLGKKPSNPIKLSEIFKAIIKIVLECQGKGYLYKAGIMLNNKNKS